MRSGDDASGAAEAVEAFLARERGARAGRDPALQLPAHRARCGAPPLPRRGRSRLDDPRRAADPGPGQAGLPSRRATRERPGPCSSGCCSSGLAVAKRVRSETGISRGTPCPWPIAAVELARQIFERPRRAHGAAARCGEDGGARRAAPRAPGVSRSWSRAAPTTARRWPRRRSGGRRAHWDDGARAACARWTSSSAAPRARDRARRGEVPRRCAARRGRPLFLIDIAVPRDIDPAGQHARQTSTSTTSTTCRPSSTRTSTSASAPAAARGTMIEAEVEAFAALAQRAADVTPTIVALRERADATCGASELERQRHRLGSLTPEQQRARRGAGARRDPEDAAPADRAT